jgi:hypothetical protein
VVSFTPWTLYPRENIYRYPVYRRMGGHMDGLEVVVRRKKSLSLQGIEPPAVHPIDQSLY